MARQNDMAEYKQLSMEDRKKYDQAFRDLAHDEAEEAVKREIRKRREALHPPRRYPSTSKIIAWIVLIADIGGIIWVMKLMEKYPEYAISSGLYTLIGLFATTTATIIAYFLKSAADHKAGIFDSTGTIPPVSGCEDIPTGNASLNEDAADNGGFIE